VTRRRWRIAAAAAFAVSALAVSEGTVSSGATAPPVTARSRIVFDSHRSGAWAIYTKELCCRTTLLLGGPARVDFAPAVSAAAGRIALTAEVGGNYDIYTMPIGGGRLRRITHGSSVDAFSAWSPDGGSIAFDSNRTGNWNVFVWHAGRVRRLTSGGRVNGLPAWSPDGSTIAYDSNRSGHMEIMTVGAAGGTPTQWTGTSWVTNVQPAWSPDGSTLAFSSNRSGRFQLYLLDLQTHAISRLTNDSGNDFQPAWSPDGSALAYVSRTGGVDRVMAIRRDGTGLITVSLKSGELPRWLP